MKQQRQSCHLINATVLSHFLLERPEGNIVIYHSPGLNEAVTDIQLLGGASRVLMNHEHESLGGTPSIDIPFWIHRDDSNNQSNGTD